MILADYSADEVHQARQQQLTRARAMRGLRPPANARFATRTGYYYAAQYMRARGWSLADALRCLFDSNEPYNRYYYKGLV